jgi:formylglycine-generating enzyme required for sulfatase activity
MVDVSVDASSVNGTNITTYPSGHSMYKTFTDPGNYRMGKFEITNGQFAKFATNSNVYWTGADIPSNKVSWYEAVQFTNFLNTSTGHQAAYNFTNNECIVRNKNECAK